MMKSKLWSFYKALLHNPRQIGSIVPSSKYLANAIADFIPVSDDKLVVELGPGTGAITQALLQHHIPSKNIIAIERSFELVQELNIRFPTITILQGNAIELEKLLKDYDQPIGTIVSSLPLLILTESEIQTILQQIEKLLTHDGKFIQYTYGADRWSHHFKKMEKIASKKIWRNFPPAKIYVYQLKNNCN